MTGRQTKDKDKTVWDWRIQASVAIVKDKLCSTDPQKSSATILMHKEVHTPLPEICSGCCCCCTGGTCKTVSAKVSINCIQTRAHSVQFFVFAPKIFCASRNQKETEEKKQTIKAQNKNDTKLITSSRFEQLVQTEK